MTKPVDIARERRLVEADWLVSTTWAVLHHAELTDQQYEELHDIASAHEPIRLTCGRTVKEIYIPGFLTRMNAPRCESCCNRLGYPYGEGSPKNDPACAALLAQRMKAVTR